VGGIGEKNALEQDRPDAYGGKHDASMTAATGNAEYAFAQAPSIGLLSAARQSEL
jgi:hypothetical protein